MYDVPLVYILVYIKKFDRHSLREDEHFKDVVVKTYIGITKITGWAIRPPSKK